MSITIGTRVVIKSVTSHKGTPLLKLTASWKGALGTITKVKRTGKIWVNLDDKKFAVPPIPIMLSDVAEVV